MADRPTQKFNAHITRNPSKKRGYFLLVLLIGVPTIVFGGGYWFQLDTTRLTTSIEKKGLLAPYAAWALGNKGEASLARAELIALVTDPAVSPYLRRGAASALGTLQDPTVTTYLDLAARDDPDPDVRASALQALGRSEVDNAEPTIEHALVHETEVAPLAAACRAAGALGLESQITLLVDNLQTPDYRVRTAAREGLEELVPEGKVFGDNISRWRNWLADR